MRVKSIIDRLTAECPSVNRVDLYRGNDSVEDLLKERPVLQVRRQQEDPDANPDKTGSVSQKVVETISIVYLTANLIGDVDELEDIRDEVFAAIHGWNLGDSYRTELEFIKGYEVEAGEGWVLWADTFSSSKQRRSTL